MRNLLQKSKPYSRQVSTFETPSFFRCCLITNPKAAKTPKILDDLRALFLDRQLEKWYLAVVIGESPVKGIIDAPIKRLPNSTKHQTGLGYMAKSSQSVFYKLDYNVDTNESLVLVYLHTGRTHQIRTHFSAIGHHVVGDSVYARKLPPDNEKFMYLLSYMMVFIFRDKLYTFKSAFPDSFAVKLEKSFGLKASKIDILKYRKLLYKDWTGLFGDKPFPKSLSIEV